MTNTSMTPNNNSLLYAIIGRLAVVVADGGLNLYKMDKIEPLPPLPVEAAKPAAPISAPPVAAPRPTLPPAAPAGPSAAQLSQARRAMERGYFITADRTLDEAERLYPNAPR